MKMHAVQYGVKNRNKGYSTWKMDKYFLLLYGLDIEEEIKLWHWI